MFEIEASILDCWLVGNLIHANLQRYPRPKKEYRSFSLIYDDRSLDLICKDKDEAEVWFTGLKALISHGLQQKGRAETKNGVTSEANSPRSHTQRSSPLSSPFCSGDSSQKDEVEPFHPHATVESPPKVHLEKALSDAMLYALPPKVPFPSDSASGSLPHFSLCHQEAQILLLVH